MKKSGNFFQVLRFLTSGSISVSAYYITFYCSTEFWGVHYILSSIIAGILLGILNFTLQKLWTFKNKEKKGVQRQAMQYFALLFSLFVLNTLFLYALVEYVHLWYILAQVISTVVLTIISYFVTRKIFVRTISTTISSL